MNGIELTKKHANNAGNKAKELNKDYISYIIVIYLISFTFLLITFSFFVYSSQDDKSFTDPLIRHLIYIGSAGGLGGIVYCMRGFYEHKSEGDFNPNYLYWYLFRPIISTITGIFVFFLFSASLLDVSGLPHQSVEIGDVMFLCSVAFLAGFGFTQFYGKIDDLANTLFQPSDKRKNSNITWKNPDAIIYGTELSGTQLNAKASVAGKFVYNPAEKDLLSAGTKELHVDFIPDEISNYKTASKSVTIDVQKATPEIICDDPDPISSGTKFTKNLLNVQVQNPITKKEIKEGNFAFTLENGTIVKEGTELEVGQHILKAVFTPTDTTNYNPSEPKEVHINVVK